MIRRDLDLIGRGSSGARRVLAEPEAGLGPVLVLALAGLDAGLWLLGTPLGARFAEILAFAP